MINSQNVSFGKDSESILSPTPMNRFDSSHGKLIRLEQIDSDNLSDNSESQAAS